MRFGSYEVEAELGRGGAGRVYRARHATTGATRALKVLEGSGDPEVVARFEREAEALARAGPAVTVAVHESGSERGRTFYVMDLMAGGSLAARLAARRPWPWHEAVDLAARLARAVARCHEVGLIHRDLKPANILFDEQGEARLADFGCARDLAAATLTASGTALGTPGYMAPEQLDGGRGDERSDVYALGVILHELVAGHVPHDGQGWRELLLQQERGLPALVAAAAGAPRELDSLLARALERQPARRTPTAAALAEGLEALAREAPGDGAAPGRRTSGRGLAVVAALALALIAGASALFARRGDVRPVALATPSPPRAIPVPSATPTRTPRAPGLDVASLEADPALAASLVELARTPDGAARLARLAQQATVLPLAAVRDAAAVAPGSPELAVLEVVASIVSARPADWTPRAIARAGDLGTARLLGLGKGGALVLAAVEVATLRARFDGLLGSNSELEDPSLSPALERLRSDGALLAAVVAPLASACRTDAVNGGVGVTHLEKLLRGVPVLQEVADQLAPQIGICLILESLSGRDRDPRTDDGELVRILHKDAAAVEREDPLLAARAYLRALELSRSIETFDAPLLAAIDRARSREDMNDAPLLRISFVRARWLASGRLFAAQDGAPADALGALEAALPLVREAALSSSVVLNPNEALQRENELVAILLALGRRPETRDLGHMLAAEDPLRALLEDSVTRVSLEAATRAGEAAKETFLRSSAAGLRARLARADGDLDRAKALEGDPDRFAWLARLAYDGRMAER